MQRQLPAPSAALAPSFSNAAYFLRKPPSNKTTGIAFLVTLFVTKFVASAVRTFRSLSHWSSNEESVHYMPADSREHRGNLPLPAQGWHTAGMATKTAADRTKEQLFTLKQAVKQLRFTATLLKRNSSRTNVIREFKAAEFCIRKARKWFSNNPAKTWAKAGQ